MWSVSVFSMALALSLVPRTGAALAEGECEVCLTFLRKFYESLKEDGVTFNIDDIKKALVKSCSDATGKDERFCYYIGAMSFAPSPMINEVTRLISYSFPVEKVCERLKNWDAQLCVLKYPTTSSSSR
ncbi:mesencephalic astrocyte-derived neurotrophic factor-like isoform 1-T1 [Synchiropus picturatus]